MEEEEMLQQLAELGPDLTAHDIRHLTYVQRQMLAEMMMINVDQLPTFEKEARAKLDDEMHQEYMNEQRWNNR